MIKIRSCHKKSYDIRMESCRLVESVLYMKKNKLLFRFYSVLRALNLVCGRHTYAQGIIQPEIPRPVRTQLGSKLPRMYHLSL